MKNMKTKVKAIKTKIKGAKKGVDIDSVNDLKALQALQSKINQKIYHIQYDEQNKLAGHPLIREIKSLISVTASTDIQVTVQHPIVYNVSLACAYFSSGEIDVADAYADVWDAGEDALYNTDHPQLKEHVKRMKANYTLLHKKIKNASKVLGISVDEVHEIVGGF
jgi:hypothetical protein